MRMKPASRGVSRGFGPRLFIRVRLRVYLPVDIGGALIGGVRHLRVFILIHTVEGSKRGAGDFKQVCDPGCPPPPWAAVPAGVEGAKGGGQGLHAGV